MRIAATENFDEMKRDAEHATLADLERIKRQVEYEARAQYWQEDVPWYKDSDRAGDHERTRDEFDLKIERANGNPKKRAYLRQLRRLKVIERMTAKRHWTNAFRAFCRRLL